MNSVYLSNCAHFVAIWFHTAGISVSNRLKFLPYAKQIIETSTTIQNITTKGKRTFYALEAMIAVKENDKDDLGKVRVILVEDKNRNIDFLFSNG